MENIKELVEKLTKNNKTISTMESCTGGAIVNEITNIEGASEIIKFSAITYSNEYKMKMGVDRSIIEKFSVYSKETAEEMAKKISLYTASDYGIGITGKLNRIDKNNLYGKDNIVYISIYDKDKDKYHTTTVEAVKQSRKLNKELVVEEVIKLLSKLV